MTSNLPSHSNGSSGNGQEAPASVPASDSAPIGTSFANQRWAGLGGSDNSPVPWRRYLAALIRYKWLMLGVVALGSGAGFALTRFLQPEYEVQGTIWISKESAQSRALGPIRSSELMDHRSWPELLRSFTILDSVVQQVSLYIKPKHFSDRAAFAGFAPAAGFRPGVYALSVDEGARTYTLVSDAGYFEQGAVGDSIGRPVGFGWSPDVSQLRPGRQIEFTLITPREASVALRDRLSSALQENSSLMRLFLTDTDPEVAARTMNTLLRQFVSEAAALKRRSVSEFALTLRQQLAYSERDLKEAEIALESFRVNTITLPSEGGAPAPGVQETRDPVIRAFFNQRVEVDSIRNERLALERTTREIGQGSLEPSALWAVPAVRNGPDDLRAALNELTARETSLRIAQQSYTDEHRSVRDLQGAIAQLRDRTIPQLVGTLALQLQRREQDLNGRISTASRQIREIPARTIEEMRLRRNVEVRASLYTTLKNKYEEARLAEASTIPDVSILDSAVAPLRPSSNTAPRLFAMTIIATLGAAMLLAVLLDRFDHRFRYPEQATTEMGLTIFGAVPNVPGARKRRPNPQHVTQVVEAFRSIRLNVRHAFPADGPVFMTITSPGPGDGKSLIASNLALSFSESGCRTLLVDGDIRRGALHRTFGVTRRPGLIDYLVGSTTMENLAQPTTHERLFIVPCGTRRPEGPELLTAPPMTAFMRHAKSMFDVVIVDSPPLGAGIDPFVLATHTTNMVLVMRAGETDRRMAQVKLELVERLPINLLGVILNDISAEAGIYQYYTYLPGYATSEDQDEAFAGSRVGQLREET